MSNNFVTKWGAAAGIFTGVAIVTYLTVFEVKLCAVFPFLGSLGDTNVGIVALLANIVVLVVVSFATRPSTVAKEQRA
jgi:SSS family solute:Na+ symporter